MNAFECKKWNVNLLLFKLVFGDVQSFPIVLGTSYLNYALFTWQNQLSYSTKAVCLDLYA